MPTVTLDVTHVAYHTPGMTRTPIHPGEHLREELEFLNLSAAGFARQLNVPTNRITGILNGRRADLSP